jgi:glucose/arabinose dehydrogenase
MRTAARRIDLTWLVFAAVPLLGCSKARTGPPGVTPIEVATPRSAGPDATTSTGPVPSKGRCRGTPLPADQHYAAPGTCARLVASAQGPLREIMFTPDGDLIGVTHEGVVRRYRDRNGNGQFDAATDEIVDWANTGGDNGQNCDLDGAYLYCGSQDGVKRWKYATSLDHGGEGEDVVVGQPGGGNHPLHPLHVYDHVLYVDSGSERNVIHPMPADYITDRAVIKRFDLQKLTPGHPFAWEAGDVFVRGARNVTGFTRDAKGRIYGVINGVDDLRYAGEDIHADNPGEAFVRLEQGQAYGWPFCFMAQRIVRDGVVVPPGTQLKVDAMNNTFPQVLVEGNKDDAWCAAHATRPMSLLEAHSAPLDVIVNDGPAKEGLPERWRGGAFVSLHGSWDRNPSTGYKVVWIPLDEAGVAPMPTSTPTSTRFPYEVVFGGGSAGQPKDGFWSWSNGLVGETVVRPVGIAISPIDGALYVSSDNRAVEDQPGKKAGESQGAIYRIAAVE